MATTVVHCKRERYDVYIGRPSIWGNPFNLNSESERSLVIKQYAAWIQTQPQLLARLRELKGKVLGCWCSPRSCHGHVLAALADEL